MNYPGNSEGQTISRRHVAGVLAVALGLAVVAAGGMFLSKRTDPSTTEKASNPAPDQRLKDGKPGLRGREAAGPGSRSRPARDVVRSEPAPSAPAPPRGETSKRIAPTATARPPSEASLRMIRAVWDRGGAAEPMTAGQAAVWRQNFDNIVRAGAGSVPAIAAFLSEARDTVFTPEESEILGFHSAREAMVAALAQMGGPEATAAMEEAMQSTASPREVAMLAGHLEAAAPGQYQEQALAAARDLLAMAIDRKLENRDVAPLFQVLQIFGGAGAVEDLERAATHWGQYATLALAALPDEAGVPSLLRMADMGPNSRPNSAKLQALQVVAQLASSNDDARASLVAQARAGRISPMLWPYLAKPLSGEQARVWDAVIETRADVPDDVRTGTVHIAGSNQNLIWARPAEGLTPAQTDRQLALVDELISVTSDPDGRRALDQARALIMLHSAPSAAAAQPR